jgi:benzoyl-CoA reductase/2-hydroxyglutaryl-CoA dehydratase subunit BcrC/BadD/HgdB
MELDIPRRRDVIAEWKRGRVRVNGGGLVAAVFPIHYPRELLRAHGFLPVEVWGPPGIDDSAAGAHLQAYTCAIVRNGLAFLLSGGLDEVDAILVPDACDSLQGLGSVLLDFVQPRMPVATFYPPRSTRPSDAEYLVRELRSLGEGLARISGAAAGDDELREAIDREARADELTARLLARRLELPLTDLELYRLLRSREYLPAERYAELAERVLAEAEPGRGAGGGDGIPIMLSGIVPEPMELFEALAETGAVVVADDLACCGRRVYPPGLSDEPYRRMAERLQGGPPDPMRGSPIQARIHHLRRLARGSGARGVIFYDVKFCEPEQFDLPLLREALRDSGVPSLALEVDLSGRLPGQTVTRLDAFVEMLR